MSQPHDIIDQITFSAAKEMMGQKFEKIIGYYLEDARVYIDTIKEGLDKKDAEMIVPAAHTIKSSSRQIGASTLANMAASIEEAGRVYMQNNNFEQIAIKCKDLELAFQATEKEIKNRLVS